jgi:hypothetical protein
MVLESRNSRKATFKKIGRSCNVVLMELRFLGKINRTERYGKIAILCYFLGVKV